MSNNFNEYPQKVLEFCHDNLVPVNLWVLFLKLFEIEPFNRTAFFHLLQKKDINPVNFKDNIRSYISYFYDEALSPSQQFMILNNIKNPKTMQFFENLFSHRDEYYNKLSKVLNCNVHNILKNSLTPDEIIDLLDLDSYILYMFITKNISGLTEHCEKIYDNIIDYYDLNLNDFFETIKEKYEELLNNSDSKDELEEIGAQALTQEDKETLLKYGEFLDEKIKNNERINSLIGRTKEVEKLIFALNRKDKPNAILVGPPGTGKTQIVIGLAERIVNKHETIPSTMLAKKIFSLQSSAVISGASLLGQFEKRINEVITILKKTNNKIILFIDEIHNIIGMGGNLGSNDFSNIIKPFLTSGDIQVIGATTEEEYKKFIEKDSAFERRFDKVVINEPSKSETKTIILGIKNKYEKFHRVNIAEDVIDGIIELTNEYIKYRYYPDKAIDILDKSCTHCKLLKQKDVTIEHVKHIINLQTGIPIENLDSDQKKRLRKLDKTLRNRIFSQDEAIDSVTSIIKFAKMGFKEKNKPIGSFLFLGPTGVGKTETVKTLAQALYGEEKILRLDMSEFMEHHSISKLIGSPAGYVGYSDNNMFTDVVKNNPYSIILLDEIEKAHPRILDLFLQILDEGKIKDARGKTINFENTIIFMTSNIGSSSITKKQKFMGFGTEINENSIIKENVNKELRNYLRPEFINRIDRIVIFNKLDDSALMKILDRELTFVSDKLKKNFNSTLKVSKNMKKFIVSKVDKNMGARPIRRLVKKYILNELLTLLDLDTYPKTIEFKINKSGEPVCITK